MLEENNTYQRRACRMRWWQLQRLRSNVVQNLTATMDSGLVKIIEKKGRLIDM